MINIITKAFDQLTTTELYAILKLRSAVFVVEQDCVYQDIDDKDQKALHVIGKIEGDVVAYTRIFKPGDYFSKASIGRVVVKDTVRKDGLGIIIMNASIKMIEDDLQESLIHLSAQTYLKRFYNSLGFKEIGEEYLEDGIPHIGMLRTKSE